MLSTTSIRRHLSSLLTLTALVSLSLTGCAGGGHDHHDDRSHQHASTAATSGAASAAVATPEQVAAYPLATCVVSGEKLDEHGKPVNYMYNGRLVRFCCNDCIDEFKKDPAKYLQKIDAAAAGKGEAGKN
jgi:YHS domain-containing protein